MHYALYFAYFVYFVFKYPLAACSFYGVTKYRTFGDSLSLYVVPSGAGMLTGSPKQLHADSTRPLSFTARAAADPGSQTAVTVLPSGRFQLIWQKSSLRQPGF